MPVRTLVVDAHDDRAVDLILRGSGQQHFLGAGGDVHLQFFTAREHPCAFDDDVHTQVLPGEFGRILLRHHLVLLAVRHNTVGISGDGAGIFPVDGIIFQQIGQCFCIGDIIDAEDIEPPGLHHAAEHQPADAPETIDSNVDCHAIPPV